MSKEFKEKQRIIGKNRKWSDEIKKKISKKLKLDLRYGCLLWDQ